MINEERTIIKDDINIGITIAYKDKKEKRPLVLLISGTGSLDRDGNSMFLKTNLYKDLSDMFVELGFVCIRYDKRGTHESKVKNLNFGLSDLVNDAATIIKNAKKLDYVDNEKIVICGHSEGAMIATLLTKKENLKGIILLGGACMGLKEASLYQNYLVLEQVKDMKGILGWYLRKTLKSDKIEEQVSELFDIAEKTQKDKFFYKGSILPTKYIREHHKLTDKEYIELLKSYKGKILAITGKSDVQADYRKLQSIENLENATIFTPEELNHMLRDIEDKPNIMNIKKEYKKSFKKEISPKLKRIIKDWVKKL